MYVSDIQKIMLGYIEDLGSMITEYKKTKNIFTKQLIHATIDKLLEKDSRYKEMLKCEPA